MLLETAVMNDPCGDLDTLTTRALSAVNYELNFVHKKLKKPITHAQPKNT